MGDRVLGLDGFKKRWLGVTLVDGRFLAARVFKGIVAALNEEREASVVAIDIPIGLPNGHGRPADHEARELVGGRRSSVFLTFPEAVFAAPSYFEAAALARQLTGKAITQQAYALRAKIKEAAISAKVDTRVIEVHPEVSFRELAGTALTFSKKTWNGLSERRLLLQTAHIEIPRNLPGEAGTASPDDVLDAAIAAWTARRVARGSAKVLPAESAGDPPPRTGVIWY